MIEFEKKIFNELSAYAGKTQNDLCLIFSVDSKAKNLNELLLTKMLGYSSKAEYNAEISKAGIVPKTIRVQKSGRIKESMSFPTFKFTEIVNETWEDSLIYIALHNTRFMFVIFEETSTKELAFSRVKFWTISENDLQEVKKVWERTVATIKEGVILKSSNGVTHNNLPKASENPVAHVRPHARNGNDTYPLPDGRAMTKQCFWLNSTYVEKIIKETAEDLYGQASLSTDEETYLNTLLVNDFYFLQDITSLFIEKFGCSSWNHINPQTLKKLGYICYPEYIVKARFFSAESYFNSLIAENGTINLNKWDPRMIQSAAAIKALNTLRSNLDILEYNDGQYVTFSQIHEIYPHITKAALQSFADAAIQYAGQDVYFNIRSLKNRGFSNPLFSLGFSDLFYNSILKYSGKVKFIVVGTTEIFYTGSSPATYYNLIQYMLKDERQMDIESLTEKFKNGLGLDIPVSAIIALAENSNLYYNPSTQKVYCTKQDFYSILRRQGAIV